MGYGAESPQVSLVHLRPVPCSLMMVLLHGHDESWFEIAETSSCCCGLPVGFLG